MKNLKLLFSLLGMLFIVSCSKDDDSTNQPTEPDFNSATIVTKSVTLASDNSSFSTGGTVSISLSNGDYQVGVCYSDMPNPTDSDQIGYSNQINGSDFSSTIYDPIIGQKYYIRAFVRKFSTGQIKYGNQIVYEIPLSLTTSIVKNISTVGFSVDVNVGNSLSGNFERGVCYSTTQNPTVNNSTVAAPTDGAGDFTIAVDGSGLYTPFYYVNSNTTYYLRSYVKMNNTTYYGNQVSFRTAGYVGGSGGYVFFDKGETTNGWRYLESAPSELTTSSYSSFKWGNSTCGYSFLNGIGNAIGDGQGNTTLIKSYCNYTNVAATMCRATSLNGQTDWFLPSVDEAKELYKLKFTNLVNMSYNFITSSQSSNSLCFAINVSNGNSYTTDKFNSFTTWQVRRF